MINKHLIHKKSSSLVNGSAKLPIATDVEYGELAINYLKDNETISIKNSADEIVTFLTSKNNENKYVNVSGDTMTGALNIETTLNVGNKNTVSGEYAFAQGIGSTASGSYSHAEGWDTTASATSSHAEGWNTTANGSYSHAEGRGTKAEVLCSHAEGWITTANGDYSHAEGESTTANGESSHAEGESTTANGESSHAEGNHTTAGGERSHAEGSYTYANGNYSHAEGERTTASGIGSHVEGGYTTASGESSHAEGKYTKAIGNYSHAEGERTTANNRSEHASGSYNVSISGDSQDIDALTTNSSATLFSIGNGTDERTPKNAFEVKWNGDAYFSGDTKFAKGITANTISATTMTATTFSGNATSASKLQTPRTITLVGDVTGSVVFDGSGNVTLTDTIVPTYAGSAAKGGAATSANKVNSTLSFAAGAFTVKSFDGSAAVSVNVPTKTSDLTNDSNFVTTATDKYLTGVTGSANGTMTFARINETALTFDSKHVHPISEVTSLQASLDAKVDDSEYNTFVTNTNTALGTKLAITTYNTYTAATKTAIDGKQPNGDYATNTTVTNGLATKVDNSTYNTYTAATDTAIAGKAPSVHNHTIAQVTGLQTALDGKQATLVSGTNIKTINGNSLLGSGDIVLVTDISGKVDKTTYNAYVTATDTAIAGKAPLSHTHTIAQVIDLQGALDSKFATTGGLMTGSLSVQGTISASTQIYSSDITLKENIDLISDEDISVVRSLSAKAYMFKEDVERRVRYGVIAQDVESTKLDELVYSDEEGIKGIDYISYLVLKCEQLQRDLNVLQSKFGNI